MQSGRHDNIPFSSSTIRHNPHPASIPPAAQKGSSFSIQTLAPPSGHKLLGSPHKSGTLSAVNPGRSYAPPSLCFSLTHPLPSPVGPALPPPRPAPSVALARL
ncbi:hypothetical protein Mapa_009243 [Marchantia paleacea]|nr:hypothetical protein Mapa_009243 [Marchantia paleacea]